MLIIKAVTFDKGAMSRPLALCFVLLVLILTSQSDWKQQSKNETEPGSGFARQNQVLNKREVIKEQIILSQEKRIYILTELVNSLQQQLAQCQDSNSESPIEIVADRMIGAGQPENDV